MNNQKPSRKLKAPTPVRCIRVLDCAESKQPNIMEHFLKIQDDILKSMGVPPEYMELKPMGIADTLRAQWRMAAQSNCWVCQ